MESQPQNPEFRNNPENFQPCTYVCIRVLLQFLINSDLQLSFHGHTQKLINLIHILET